MLFLITNPKKILTNRKFTNFFLGKWFLNYLKKKNIEKINIKFNQNVSNNLIIQNELKKNKICNKLYIEIINELYPKLNKLNNINWKYKTWNFFLGHWLNFCISVIVDRIYLVKNLDLKKVNADYQLNIGKKASLTTYNLKDFTYNCGLIEWNEKLFSRIIYLIKTKNYNNEENFFNSKNIVKTLNQSFFQKFSYNIKIYIIKFLERILCFKNNFFFYNSYIADKFKLLKIQLKLKNFPFVYSFQFFNNNQIKKGFNIEKRNKIKLNISNKPLIDKIVKFLIPELIPTIYFEGFNDQLNLAKTSHLPKKIKKIFTSAAYADDTFKFWLASKINENSKLYYGQHGGGYNIYKDWFGDKYEYKIANKNFIWGKRSVIKKKINIGNYLIPKKSNQNTNQKQLIVLPPLDILKRTPVVRHLNYFDEEKKEIQSLISNIKINKLNQYEIRPHPQDKRREFEFIKFLKINKRINIVNNQIEFKKISNNYSLLIFTYLSTEFFIRIALNKPCFLLINKQFFDKYMLSVAKDDFKKLLNIGIVHLNGRSLSKKIKKDLNQINYWWFKENNQQIIKEFCKNYTDPNFNDALLIKKLKND